MINASTAFKTKIANDERDYIIGVTITLTDNTVLTIDNTEIASNGLSIEEAVGSDSTFDALGGAVINKCTLTLSNIERDFTQYSFQGAQVVISIGLNVGTSIETIRKGVYIVDEAKYSDWTVTLTALDKMALFDVLYSNCHTTYPATLLSIVQDICSTCGVVLGTVNFPYRTDTIQTRPTTETITCRQVLSWVAQMVGCYAYIGYGNNSSLGQLKFDWFNTSALEQEFDDLDTIFPDTSVIISDPTTTINRPIYYTTGINTTDIDVDDIVITGVRVSTKNPATNTDDKLLSSLQGSEGYVIEISESNELISSTNYVSIAQRLGNLLNGTTFRRVNLTSLNNPLIQAGDVAITYDRKYAFHPILITRTEFSPFGRQTIICGAESPVHNSAAGFSNATKSYVQMRKITDPEFGYLKSQQDLLREELEEAIASNQGMYGPTEYPVGSNVRYLHDKPILEESSGAIKITDSGVGVTADLYNDFTTGQSATWYGLTVDGTLIANVVSTMSAFFTYAHGGLLKLGGAGNGNGQLQVVDADNNEIGRWNNNGIQLRAGFISLGGTTTEPNFRVTTGGNVTIKHGSISLGTVTISGTNYAAFYVDDDGDFRLRKGAINLGDGNFVVTTAGVVTIKQGAINLGQSGSDYKFKVTNAGKLTATDAEIKGEVLSTGVTFPSSNKTEYVRMVMGELGGGAATDPSSPTSSEISTIYFNYGGVANNGLALESTKDIWLLAPSRYVWINQGSLGQGTVVGSLGSTNNLRVHSIEFYVSGGSRFLELYNFSGNVWALEVSTSDEKLKTNIQESKVNALDIINKIEHKQFEYKEGGECANGYVAQQLEEVNPDFVVDIPQKTTETSSMKKGEAKPETIKHVRTFEILSYATKAIQELSAKVDELEARVAELEKERGENR